MGILASGNEFSPDLMAQRRITVHIKHMLFDSRVSCRSVRLHTEAEFCRRSYRLSQLALLMVRLYFGVPYFFTAIDALSGWEVLDSQTRVFVTCYTSSSIPIKWTLNSCPLYGYGSWQAIAIRIRTLVIKSLAYLDGI